MIQLYQKGINLKYKNSTFLKTNHIEFQSGAKSFQFKNIEVSELHKIGNWSIYILISSSSSSFFLVDLDKLVCLLEKKDKNTSLEIPYLCPSFIAFEETNENLFVYNSSSGFQPIWYHQLGNNFTFTTQTKSFVNNDDFDLKLRPISFVENLSYHSFTPKESIFKDINWLRKGELLLSSKNKTDTQFPTSSELKTKIQHKEGYYVDTLFNILDQTVNSIISNKKEISLSLSGGYDSGALAGILSKKNIPINTLTIGTKYANEFKEAALTSELVGANHRCVEIKESEYLQLYLKSVYLNEINQPTIAEGYPGIYKTYESLTFQTDLFTGYGADLLLGDVYGHGCKLPKQDSIKNILTRTASTGELNPFIADSFQTKTHPIYLSGRMVKFCLSIPSELKSKNGLNKYVQRKMIEKYKLMPLELLDIKKKALHTGSGLPYMFENILGISKHSDKNYLKIKFMYHTLSMLFEQAIPVNKCDTEQLIHQTLNNTL